MSKPAKTLLNNYFKIKTEYNKMPKTLQGIDDLGDYDNTSISTYVHWTTDNYRVFVPAAPTIKSLVPGVYEMHKSDNIGLYFEKIPVRSEGLLRFPDTNSERVVKEIQKFWEREDVFESYNLTYKRGILLYGPPGCHAKGTKILMYNGDLKKVEDIVVGDEVMGPDSRPRRVLELIRGQDQMYKITPNRGEPFVVNGHHILSLQRSSKRDCATPEILNISLNNYKKLSKPSQVKYKLRRVNKDPLLTGISLIESLGLGDFYGFTLSGDHLYLTDDFIVHHNSGKSCTIQLIMEDVVNRDGVIIKFTDPFLFTQGMRVLRQIQEDTPVVVIIEDIDSFLEIYNESEILNVLDGVNEVNKVVFLATTNYPEKLGARIVNRPSRFDKRFRIGYPSKTSRRMYFEHLIGEGDENKLKQKISDLNLDLDRWVEDTDEMSVAHLKELFIQVVIIGDTYEESIETLKSMKENLEDKEFDSVIGFSGPKKSKNYYG